MTRFLEDFEKLLETTVRHYSTFSLCLIQHYENTIAFCLRFEIRAESLIVFSFVADY